VTGNPSAEGGGLDVDSTRQKNHGCQTHARRSGRASATAVVTIAIAFVQELLIFAFQVVLEDDAVDVRAFVTEAFGFLLVGEIEFRIMLQFPRLRDAGIECSAVALQSLSAHP